MTTIHRTLKILSVRAIGEMIHLDLIAVEPSLTTQPAKILRPEDVIEPLPKSDTEKVGMEITKGMIEQFRRSGMSGPILPTEMSVRLPMQQLMSLVLTVEEYEKLGKPTPLDGIRIEIEVA